MKGERAAMMARCIVILSPATSNAKSHHGASSRLEQHSTLPQFPPDAHGVLPDCRRILLRVGQAGRVPEA